MTVTEFYLKHPDLMENEVWELLGIEGNKEISLTSLDKYSQNSVTNAFLELTKEGYLSRKRLLDVTLAALLADYPQYRAGWFSRFHNLLEPTEEETAERVDAYLELLASKIPPTVSFALDYVRKIDKSGRLNSLKALHAIRPVFYANDKGTINLALKLVSHWSSGPDGGYVTLAIDAVRPALEHSAREVRESIEKFLEQHGETSTKSDALLTTENAMADFPTPNLTPPEPLLQICPIATVDELVEVFSAVIENEGPPKDLERVLDAVSRLSAQRPLGFERLTTPFRKRCTKHLGDDWAYGFLGSSVRLIFASLGMAWLEAKLPSGKIDNRHWLVRNPGLRRFAAARVKELAVRITSKSNNSRDLGLLAAPTHEGGWIDPGVFLDRLNGRDVIDRLDLIQAILRLSPDGREAALVRAKDLPGEIGEAVRHALGAVTEQAGSDLALWAAASRTRDPLKADLLLRAMFASAENSVFYGPDIDQPAEIEFGWTERVSTIEGKVYRHYYSKIETVPELPKDVPIDFPTLIAHEDFGTRLSRAPVNEHMLRWTAEVLPANSEAWFAAGCRAIGENLDWWEAQWQNKAYLEPLIDRTVHFGKMALTLLALGLAAKDPGEGTLASDALVNGIIDGRLAKVQIETVITMLLEWPGIKLPRVSGRLKQVAGISAMHAEILRDALISALETSSTTVRSNLGEALDLLYELLIVTDTRLPEGRLMEHLMSQTGSTKAAKLAKKIRDFRNI
jgi:hypothetical protein